FENALYTDKLVEAHNFRDVILVTSDYHMPRSYLIMRLLTSPSVRIQRYSVHEINESESSWQRLIQKWRLLMSEMVELYGTLVQAAIYPSTNLQ
ncbi:MAG: YdcF family protein, partial [Desulfobacterales bacterium]|nr:YdcF family protein [Desulfobacterales bacterium]